ncbi:mediator of RNA polymerase II transcription complex subunit 8-domain-containing protein [Calycina marina]|uniref:Mediator of RNA polymerase II transcription subunit 8 n=1 Tax=Calycina marina TaxID=1763456 RepID=A0A9P7YVK4_9HELO|nr:mediator of RNA polymerase II transcription complex subunit 8-domain-containing protein [Calycina marina]
MLAPEELKAVDRLRQQLGLLCDNLIALRGRLVKEDPLLEWSSLQQFTKIVAEHLISLANYLEKYSELFSSTVAFPLPEYPGRIQLDLLQHILRKRLDPATESWVEQGLAANASLGVKVTELEELWEWAKAWLDDRFQTFIQDEYDNPYTAEEEELGWENVRTGLQPEHQDEDEDEDHSEDEESGMKKQKEPPKPPSDSQKQPERTIIPTSDILRFSSGAGLVARVSNSVR